MISHLPITFLLVIWDLSPHCWCENAEFHRLPSKLLWPSRIRISSTSHISRTLQTSRLSIIGRLFSLLTMCMLAACQNTFSVVNQNSTHTGRIPTSPSFSYLYTYSLDFKTMGPPSLSLSLCFLVLNIFLC